MNTQEIINNNIRNLLDPMAKRHIAGPNYSKIVAINRGNSEDHEAMKTRIVHRLLNEGRTIITEAKLKNGKRPDVLVLDSIQPVAYEIIKSEKKESIAKKRENYLGIIIEEVRI